MFILFYTDKQGFKFYNTSETLQECIEGIENEIGEPIDLDRCEWFKACRVKVTAKTEYVLS